MKTKLITRRGYQQLQRELDHLWRTERPEVTKKVAWAASLAPSLSPASIKLMMVTGKSST